MLEHKEKVDSVYEYITRNGLDIGKRGVVSYIDRETGRITFSDNWYYRPVAGGAKEITLDTKLEDPIAATHVELYRLFSEITSIIICQPKWCTVWAQLGEEIPPTGILHADSFYGAIPCTERPDEIEIHNNYSYQMALKIKKALGCKTPKQMSGVLLKYIGAVILENSVSDALNKLKEMEMIAELAWQLRLANGDSSVEYLSYGVLNKHHELLHGGANHYLSYESD